MKMEVQMLTACILIITFICNLVKCDPIHSLSRGELRNRWLNYAKLPGLALRETKNLPIVEYDKELLRSLPETFDPREKWPFCPSLKEIRDQGRCGSCWALSTVAAMTDRVCIHSNGTKHFHFSAEDMVSCNDECNGCHGGDLYEAWDHWVQNGIVSGGNYGSNQGCKPYSIPLCPHHMKNCTNYLPGPKCERSCRKGYNISYEQDLRYGKSLREFRSVEQIMAELYKNGPITVAFYIYEDFANYTGGVYHHVTGKLHNGHAVKMMGWGVEDGKKYWLIANSWGTDFGENGFFKILRGTNECRIETTALVAALPVLDDY